MSGDRARTRFFAIQAIRWLGVVLAILGMLALNGRVLSRGVSYVLLPLGLLAVFVAPLLLARRWRTRGP